MNHIQSNSGPSEEPGACPHPSCEELIRLFCDELAMDEQARLADHVSGCSDCRSQLEVWQRVGRQLNRWPALMTSPDREGDRGQAGHGGQPVPHSKRRASIPWSPRQAPTANGRSKGVLIAALSIAVVLLSFLAGQSVSGTPDFDQIRTELSTELRSHLLAELKAELQAKLHAEIHQQLASFEPDQSRLLPLIETESNRIASAQMASWAVPDNEIQSELRRVLTDVLRNQLSLRKDLETLAVEADAQIVRTRREMNRMAFETVRNGQEQFQLPVFEP